MSQIQQPKSHQTSKPEWGRWWVKQNNQDHWFEKTPRFCGTTDRWVPSSGRHHVYS